MNFRISTRRVWFVSLASADEKVGCLDGAPEGVSATTFFSSLSSRYEYPSLISPFYLFQVA